MVKGGCNCMGQSVGQHQQTNCGLTIYRDKQLDFLLDSMYIIQMSFVCCLAVFCLVKRNVCVALFQTHTHTYVNRYHMKQCNALIYHYFINFFNQVFMSIHRGKLTFSLSGVFRGYAMTPWIYSLLKAIKSSPLPIFIYLLAMFI